MRFFLFDEKPVGTLTPHECLFLLRCQGKANEWQVVLSIRSFLSVQL
jgi:hypothetical protein